MSEAILEAISVLLLKSSSGLILNDSRGNPGWKKAKRPGSPMSSVTSRAWSRSSLSPLGSMMMTVSPETMAWVMRSSKNLVLPAPVVPRMSVCPEVCEKGRKMFLSSVSTPWR